MISWGVKRIPTFLLPLPPPPSLPLLSVSTHIVTESSILGAVEAGQKYYIVREGEDVTIETTINVVPAPAADKISWKKVPNKEVRDCHGNQQIGKRLPW